MVRESQTRDYWGVEALSPSEGAKLDEGEIDDVYDVNAYVYSGGREGVSSQRRLVHSGIHTASMEDVYSLLRRTIPSLS